MKVLEQMLKEPPTFKYLKAVEESASSVQKFIAHSIFRVFRNGFNSCNVSTSKLHTRSFPQWKYKIEDIDIKKLNYEFISNYAFWLKSKRNCNHNSTIKYLANFKKVVLLCIKMNGFKKTRL